MILRNSKNMGQARVLIRSLHRQRSQRTILFSQSIQARCIVRPAVRRCRSACSSSSTAKESQVRLVVGSGTTKTRRAFSSTATSSNSWLTATFQLSSIRTWAVWQGMAWRIVIHLPRQRVAAGGSDARRRYLSEVSHVVSLRRSSPSGDPIPCSSIDLSRAAM